MSTDTLDMSALVQGWVPEDGRFATLVAVGSRPITLDFKASNVNPPDPYHESVRGTERRFLIMQARRKGEELWAIRMLPSGRLLIQPGTEPSRESRYGYPSELWLGVSFNPQTGNLSLTTGEEIFNLNASHGWALDGDYEIVLGAPEGYADQSPLGWTINCSFRYGPPAAVASLPVEDLPFTKSLAELAAAFDADPFAPRRVPQSTAQELVHKAAALTESVQDLDNERHWEAMLALASGKWGNFALDDLAAEAEALVNAHNAWKEGR